MTILIRFFLLLTLPLVLLAAPSQETINHHCHAPIPDWVKPCEFSLEPVPAKPSQVNWQCLLLDTQTHVEAQTWYRHRVVKVLSQTGVEQNGQISFDFNPEHQNIIVHMIRVYRDGQWSDRLEGARSKLLQLEDGLDKGVYDGDLTLVYFLDDIRVGDIIEYSCSYQGDNPLFSSHYCRVLSIQFKDSVEKISRRILAHPSQTFFIKPLYTSLEPRITDMSPTLREWVWEDVSTAPDIIDKYQPSWFDPSARIQISQYKSWQEVAEKLVPLYTLSQDYKAGLSLEMIDLVRKWEASTSDPMQRASLAIRFVQDEVRYQGFEDGIGAYKPRDPSEVFAKRLGDCKDKSFLLHTLLKLMDIQSTPLLVHSRRGVWLSEALPSPFAFNHVVLQISIDGTDYYVDPTITLQGGSLVDIHFPDFTWGLPISGKTGLIPLPKLFQKRPTEINTNIVLTSPESAEVTIQTAFHGLKADKMRWYIQSSGYKKLCDESIKGLKKKYGNVTSISPLTISDDRLSNILILNESYSLPTRERLGRKVLKAHSITVGDALDRNLNLERNSPYALLYPVWIKEHITVKNSFNDWTQGSEELIREHESLRYRYAFQAKGEDMEIDYELQHLKDHIPVESQYDYWTIVDEIVDSNISWIHVTPKKN